MKNFLTLAFVIISAQSALAADECPLLSAASLSCRDKLGIFKINVEAEKECGAGRDGTLILMNRNIRSAPTQVFDVVAAFKGEREPIDITYTTVKGDERTRITIPCLEN